MSNVTSIAAGKKGKNAPSEEAVVSHQLAKYMRAERELQEAKNDHQSTVKNAEAQGLHLKAAKRAIKIKNSGKTEEIVDELSKLFLYLKILGLPLTDKQMDLFAAVDERTPADDRAFEEGLYAGRMGKGFDACGYGAESSQYQAFARGHGQGSDERKTVLSMESEHAERIQADKGDDAVPEPPADDEKPKDDDDWDMAAPKDEAGKGPNGSGAASGKPAQPAKKAAAGTKKKAAGSK